MAAFMPNYLQKTHGVDTFESLVLNGIFLILAALTRTGFGPVADKFGGDKCVIVANIICAIGAAIFATAPDDTPYGWNIIGGVLVMACAQGLLNSAIFKWNPKIFGNSTA